MSNKVFSGKVKAVLSADTLVLTPLGGGSNQERILSLAYLRAPWLASNEKYSFEAREILRTLLVGKEVKFWIIYKNQANREFGDISTPIFQSLIEYVLTRGAAKLRDNLNIFDDEDLLALKQIESKAHSNQVGLWDPKLKPLEVTSQLTPKEIKKSLSTPIASIVEKVISGDRLVVRFLLSSNKQVVLPILLSGIRCPRTASSDLPTDEPFGEEAKAFVEARLLARTVEVSVIGESANGVVVATIIHPAGNISEKLLEEGLGEVPDWQSSIIGSAGMSILRKSEKTARASGKGLWKSEKAAAKPQQSALSGSDISVGNTYNAVVSKVISADTVVLRLKDDSELTVQLSSLRAPRQSDSDLAPFVHIAKDFVRSKLIGKQIKFTLEAFRPQTEQLEERAIVTIRSNDGKDLSDLIVSNGFASVLKGNKDKPDYWDSLIESENQAVKAKKGIHGQVPETERIVDASESYLRAKPYLFSFQNRTKIPGIVEYISSANRFKITLPREGLKLTLVLGGLSNSGSRDDELSKQALAFANRKAYQRDVHIDVYNVDKVGGFIGNLYLPGTGLPFQVTLLQNGFAECHERSLSQTKFGSQLLTAENEAREKKLGVWKNFDPASLVATEEITKGVENLKIEKKYFDIQVTEILEEGAICFHILDEQQKKLKPFMQQLHTQSASFPILAKPPKNNDVVAARFSENGKFYRAKVLSHTSSPATYRVQHIDYGTTESLSQSSLRALPSQFSIVSYPAQVHTGQLSLVKLPPSIPTDYNTEARYLLEDLTLEKPLVAAQTHSFPAPGVEMDIELYDPEAIATDPTWTINKEMVKCGMVIVKKSGLSAYEKLLDSERRVLLALEEAAKGERVGCWEYGDIEGDESINE